MTDTTLLAYIPSPAQGVWYLGPFPLRAYALCIIVGILVAVWWGDRRWRARGGQPGDVLDIALWAVPFGLIGGRIYHVATDWYRYFGDNGRGLSGAIAIWDGGLGIWGAVFFGALGAWIGCRVKGIKLPPFGDALAPAILLAQAIGRLGNYFNQELYGGPTTLPWGLELYVRRDGAQTGISLTDGTSTGVLHSVVHPTFLYEMLWSLLGVLILVIVDRRFRIGHGRLFALYVAIYCVGRFGIELLRTDAATEILGLRINLFTAAIVFLGAAIYLVVAPRGRETGLEVYWPGKAAELAEAGELGYVPPALNEETVDQARADHDPGDDEADEPVAATDSDAQWAPPAGTPGDTEPAGGGDTDTAVEDGSETDSDTDSGTGDEPGDDNESGARSASAVAEPTVTVASADSVDAGGIEIRQATGPAADTAMVVVAADPAADPAADSDATGVDTQADPETVTDEAADDGAAADGDTQVSVEHAQAAEEEAADSDGSTKKD